MNCKKILEVTSFVSTFQKYVLLRRIIYPHMSRRLGTFLVLQLPLEIKALRYIGTKTYCSYNG